MSDFFFKLKLLFFFLASAEHGLKAAAREWKAEVWHIDLDWPYCCDGHECRCHGLTFRQIYSPEARRAVSVPDDTQ